MFYEDITTNTTFLSILYNSKFILMATSLGTNAVVVTRVYCTFDHAVTLAYKRFSLFEFFCNDMSTLVGHFVSFPREKEKWDRRASR